MRRRPLFGRAAVAVLRATLAAPTQAMVQSGQRIHRVGTLWSYGLYRRWAVCIDRTVKGARPADLPVEEPTVHELALKLKIAKIFGRAMAQPALLPADEWIR